MSMPGCWCMCAISSCSVLKIKTQQAKNGMLYAMVTRCASIIASQR